MTWCHSLESRLLGEVKAGVSFKASLDNLERPCFEVKVENTSEVECLPTMDKVISEKQNLYNPFYVFDLEGLLEGH